MTFPSRSKLLPLVASAVAITFAVGASACSSGGADTTRQNTPAATEQTTSAPAGADLIGALGQAGVMLHPLPDEPNIGVAVAADPTGAYSTLNLAEDANGHAVGFAMMQAMDAGGYVVVLEFANGADATSSAEALMSQLAAKSGAAATSVFRTDTALALSVAPAGERNPHERALGSIMQRISGD